MAPGWARTVGTWDPRATEDGAPEPAQDRYQGRHMATKPAPKTDGAEAREESADGPLIDSVSQSVKKLVLRGKERGYVTYDELNAALPADKVSSEQIEDTMAMLSELGVNVV